MKSTKWILLLFALLLLGSSGFAAIPQQEYVTPAEPVTSLRSSMVPCYSGYRGIGRNVAGREIAGEECPAHTSSLPRRTDRPEIEGEVQSPGIPFEQRME